MSTRADSGPSGRPDPLGRFSAITREWFTSTFDAPTTAQADAWNAIADGHNTLVIAPTGSGKTLAAFLWAMDSLAGLDGARRPARGCSTSRRSRRWRSTSSATCALRWPASPGIAGTPGPARARHQRRGPFRRHPARRAVAN